MITVRGSFPAVRPRLTWVDDLRVVMIAGVIVLHVATGYVTDIAGWYYDDELDASGVASAALAVPAGIGGFFWLGPLFLVAGWFSATSLARRGPAGFLRARLVRLGVPLLVFVLLLQPLTDWVGNLRQERGSFAFYFGHTEVGALWFVAALLAFSAGYAALRQLRPAPPVARPPRGRDVAVAAVLVTVTSLAVWQVLPPLEEMTLNLRVAEWPQGAVLFALGVRAAEAGWVDAPPTRRAVRPLGWVALAGVVGLAALFAVGVSGGATDLGPSLSWPTQGLAVLDGVVAVPWTVWFVVLLAHRGQLLPRRGSVAVVAPAAARGSYAAYVVHPLPITALMLLLGPVLLDPWAKFPLVAALSVPLCFAIGYGLTRVPGVQRVA